jgi:hypothetical protein
MPALVTDIIISMDDQFLYISCWLHGEIRMYNIKNPFDVKLVGIVSRLYHWDLSISFLGYYWRPFT